MATAKIYAGQWGHSHTLTVKDQDDAVYDISAATTKAIVFEDPGGTQTSVTASFSTDGTDGKVTYTVVDGGAVDDEAGKWTRWAVLTFSDGEYTTTPEKYRVYAPGDE